jgi:chromate transport protein ChrA
MDTSDQIKPVRKYNRLAILSFVLGLMTMIFPIISILYLITENGGPGYLQSLFCGVPITLAAIIAGGVALVQIRRVNQKGNWMAILGIVFGILFFVIFYVMVVILIAPYLFGGAQ